MQNKASDLITGSIISFGVNALGVGWALGWLFVGGLGVGMSSAPTEDLQQTWSAFVWLALCCPVVLNLIFVGVCLALRRPRLLLGWAAGLLVAGVLAGCLVSLIAAYLAFLNCYPGGFGTPSHCG